ncbi:hypothetical protein GCM10028805_36650 [Spirosoma harenae]
MKAILVWGVLTVVATLQVVQAQSAFRLGVTGGANQSLINYSQVADYHKLQPIWGYNAGISFEHRLSSTLRVGYDLLYSQQGGTEVATNPRDNRNYELIMKIDYLSLPLMVRYQIAGGRFLIAGGPQLGYLLQERTIDPQLGEIAGYRWNLDYFHRVDLGLTGGLGYQIGKHLLFSTRYTTSLRPINGPYPQSSTYSEYANKIYNRVWSTNLTYYFK